MAGDTRVRILAAAVACVGRTGFGHTSIDAVADQAGVSRATVYRHFPEGREQVLDEAISWQVSQFFSDLAAHVEREAGLARRLEIGLPYAHRELAAHAVFQKVLADEPERLLPHLSTSIPLILDALRVYLAPLIEAERLAPGAVVVEAADYLARMVLTFIQGEGGWNLDDAAEVRALVRGHLLMGILEDPWAT